MNQPIRALHVLGQLEHGGVASWVRCLMKALPRDKVAIDLCCDYRLTTGALTSEFKQLGAKINWVPLSWNLWDYQNRLRRILIDGRYQIVHAHRSFNSGATLRAAAKAGVAVRIAYHHTPNDNVVPSPGRMLYSMVLRYWMLKFATHIWGCSETALKANYGPQWRTRDTRLDIVYGAVQCLKTRLDARMAIRNEFGIPGNAFVVGFIGRVTWPKNPEGAMRICLRLLELGSSIYCLFVGDGPLMQSLRNIRGMSPNASRIHLVGFRQDIGDILQSIDVFLQPSEFEGLPLSTLEALDAGLPVVGSHAPGLLEALPPEYHKFCSDAHAIESHVKNIMTIKNTAINLSRPAAWLSRFSSETFAATIYKRYSDALGRKV
jgi:glycosyltransferase involved in cell wall biosynthesis